MLASHTRSVPALCSLDVDPHLADAGPYSHRRESIPARPLICGSINPLTRVEGPTMKTTQQESMVPL